MKNKRFHIIMKPRTEEVTLTVEAPSSEEAKNVAATAYPRLEVKLVEEMVPCPWCSGEGCSYQGQAKGGCSDGEVPYSQALAMRLTNYNKESL